MRPGEFATEKCSELTSVCSAQRGHCFLRPSELAEEHGVSLTCPPPATLPLAQATFVPAQCPVVHERACGYLTMSDPRMPRAGLGGLQR